MSATADEFDYCTRVDVNMAILREMGKIRMKERLPQLMVAVAKELMAAGVDFSKARIPDALTISDEEWDAVYEDLR